MAEGRMQVDFSLHSMNLSLFCLPVELSEDINAIQINFLPTPISSNFSGTVNLHGSLIALL